MDIPDAELSRVSVTVNAQISDDRLSVYCNRENCVRSLAFVLIATKTVALYDKCRLCIFLRSLYMAAGDLSPLDIPSTFNYQQRLHMAYHSYLFFWVRQKKIKQ